MASETLAQQAVENVVKNSRQSGSEPPSVITGQGATDGPHDGGNFPETVTQPGVGPMSNQKGAGIADELYDRGNSPEHDQILGGKVNHSMPTGFSEHQGSQALQAKPIVEEAQAIAASKNTLEEKNREAMEKLKENKGTCTDGGDLGARMTRAAREARRKVSDQRDVSPGTLPDGSHAQTAQDRGEVYQVSKLSKFKNKLGFGKS